ncbi:carotenoid oxygenase [Annulohypoxylon maeteangense]|uniref:carotenoid oxygenase n=1 Tax=Annulohypoxylon maeteangense TaxID=1927788 RepID=UPI00200841E3|nr:carotenoid oxygenase [Annulohypoxylon maeteangense]KAI0880669.1 carotenoid oxygenase [Annulohypoxylon maeteangense]
MQPYTKTELFFGSSKEDEECDFYAVIDALETEAYAHWPNEAGFEGLDEVRGPIELTVKGSIPSWAAGTLFRTGPGQYTIEDTAKGTFRTTHWFDGLGHTHKFNIIAKSYDSGSPVKVEYSSRRQSQALCDAIKKTGRRNDISFGQRMDPCVGIFAKIMSTWRGAPVVQSPDFNNIAVVVYRDMPGLPSNAKSTTPSAGHRGGNKSMWLTSDMGIVKEFDHQTLEPIGIAKQQTLHPLLKGPLSCAHAQRDPATGDFFNYNLELGYPATYRVFRTRASTGETDILATIYGKDVEPAYIHSFFLSPSFVIFCIPSSHVGLMGIKIPWEGNMVDAIKPFDKSKSCKWFIVDRLSDRGVVASFDSPASFFFHSVNSFEERDEATDNTNVYCDVIQYPTLDVIRQFEMDVILQRNGATTNFWRDEARTHNCQARLVRWKLVVPKLGPDDEQGKSKNPTTNKTAEKVLMFTAPLAGELPTINPAYATKKHRYVYTTASRGFSTLFDCIVKTDIDTRECIYWEGLKGHTPGEAIFIQRPKSHEEDEVAEDEVAEDEGVLLSVILDGCGKKSYLVCLDARNMLELGRAECDFAIAIGFHGLHLPPETSPEAT